VSNKNKAAPPSGAMHLRLYEPPPPCTPSPVWVRRALRAWRAKNKDEVERCWAVGKALQPFTFAPSAARRQPSWVVDRYYEVAAALGVSVDRVRAMRAFVFHCPDLPRFRADHPGVTTWRELRQHCPRFTVAFGARPPASRSHKRAEPSGNPRRRRRSTADTLFSSPF
jgi:hypothetical protein